MAKYGNKDAKKAHDISHLNGDWTKHYVVRHFNGMKRADGSVVEDPTTSRVQVYDEGTFNAYNQQPERRDAKGNVVQGLSRFQEAGLNMDILHDPTAKGQAKEDDSKGNDGKKDENNAPAKPMAAKDLIDVINGATSAKEVDELVGDDKRATVLAAADKKKEEFK